MALGSRVSVGTQGREVDMGMSTLPGGRELGRDGHCWGFCDVSLPPLTRQLGMATGCSDL